MKKTLLLLPVIMLMAFNREKAVSPLDDMHFVVEAVAEDWVFVDSEKVDLQISLAQALEKDIKFNLVYKITTDDYQVLDSGVCAIKGKKSENIRKTISLPVTAPGFYRVTLYAEKDGNKSDLKQFNIGVEPEEIVSLQDKKDDFDEFWRQTRAELDKVAPRYKMTLLKEKSSNEKSMYHVEMYSFGDVKIEGYYTVPVGKGKYPVIVAYMGYGSEPYFPDVNGMPGFCEFVLSVRGQGIQKATNTYGEWITCGLEYKETYYYRGAFMDLIRALDFVSSRPEVDSDKIVAEGGSQGGAFTLAACALDKRIKAAAPYIPFLSDFRDYFKICPWPRELFDMYLHQHPEENWEHIYEVLTYFDIKNHASNITCPIIMGVGLQDEVCPPHTNFAGYNQIKSDKRYYIYRDLGHGVGESWWKIRADFFRKELQMK